LLILITIGYFILSINLFLPISFFIFIVYYYSLFLSFGGIKDRNIIGIALKLIKLNLYLGDKISMISIYPIVNKKDEEEDYILSEISFYFGPALLDRFGSLLLLNTWKDFIESDIGYIDTKAHTISKRLFEYTFSFYIEDLDKIKKFILEMRDRLEKEKSFEDIFVKLTYISDEKANHFVNIQNVMVIVKIDAGRKNFKNTMLQINHIAFDIGDKLNLQILNSYHKIFGAENKISMISKKVI